LKETDKLNSESNFMISPLSVAMALGMTYNGAENQTKQAFEQTLRYDGMSRSDINRIHGDLLTYLLKADPKVAMEIANSIWVDHLFTLMKAFADTNTYYYKAEVASVDFSSPGAEDIINNWVSDKTHDKITSIIDEIPSSAVMYLINAIYFYGTWTMKFDRDQTSDMAFTYGDETTGTVKAMKIKADVDYYGNDLFSAIELPYGDGKFVMDVLLPDEGNTVTDVIDWLALHSDGKWFDDFHKANDLLIRLPKFKFEYETLLNKPLQNMGLAIAFSGNADFSGMLENAKNLAISRVIHKTYIGVDEKGTEAAAVTAVEIELTSAGPGASFIVNRPFLFIIREKETASVLFTGKVGRPAWEE
jgi:serine protease inhibitor